MVTEKKKRNNNESVTLDVTVFGPFSGTVKTSLHQNRCHSSSEILVLLKHLVPAKGILCLHVAALCVEAFTLLA